MQRIIQHTIVAGVATICLTALAACDIEVEPFPLRADLEVDWSIDGSTSPALCDAYDIDFWVIEVRGPESFDVDVDCRAHYWTSESDLHDLLVGTYTVRVRALDPLGRTLAVQQARLTILDDGVIDVLELLFLPRDF
jgi:hypothetical protein